MDLSELTPELFRRAVAVYLEKAYGDSPPEAVTRFDLVDRRTPERVLELFHHETRPGPTGEPLDQYEIRLGNARYPHMKLALMQFLEPGQWVWAVDTHDQMPVTPDSPDWKLFRDLHVHNLKVKAAVEAGWRNAGLDTCRVVAKRLPFVSGEQGGPLILVVDDEQGIRQAAVNILRSADYRVAEASSGLEGIEVFVDRSPSLVLSDLDMPGMDGLGMVRRLREIDAERGKRTPILMATAGGRDMSEERALDGFLVKPYQRTLLLSFVKHQLPWDKRGSGP